MASVDTTTIIEFDLENQSHQKLSLDEYAIDLQDTNKILWIHCDLNDQHAFQKIAEKIHLADDVVNLFMQKDPTPRLVEFDDAVTVQLPCLITHEIDMHHLEETFSYLMIHLSDRYCITASTQSIPAITQFNNNFTKALKYAKTPCFILFLVMDNVVDDFAKTLFNFETITDQFDLRIRHSHENIYSEVMDVKNHTMKIRRFIIATKEILMRLSGRKMSVISSSCRASLSNLLNETHMISNEADSIRDILNNLLDQIDNVLMQKMNETMRVLTAFASIILPLTLITGIYGMNFHWIPELEWKYGYFAVLILLVVVGGILFYIFKKKKWF